MEEKLLKIKESLTKKVDDIRSTLRELNELQSDVLKLVEFYEVKVLAYPHQKVFRLSNSDGIRIQSHDLTKPIKDFIESVEVESVSFERDPHNIKGFKPKLHTIRSGSRWKAGDKIHMAYGVRSKNYQQFNKGIPELEYVKSVQSIEIRWYTFHMKPLEIMNAKGGSTRIPSVFIDGQQYDGACTQVRQLAINDGFDSLEEFYQWFSEDFRGQILHWTELRY